MTTTNRSSALQLAADRCPAAVDHLEAQVPYDRSVFAVGVAAHAILEGLQRRQIGTKAAVILGHAEEVADRIARRLVTEGRAFDGVPEAPLFPDAVSAGRDIAVRWWNMPRETAPVPMDWLPEEALAIDAKGGGVPYGRGAWWRGICDLVGPVVEEGEDEYGGGVGIEVADYKTNWNAGPAWLDSIQAKGQALLALGNAGRLGVIAPAFVRRTVINLRTGGRFSADLWLNDDGVEETLAMWRQDLALAMAHADARGPDGGRIAAPGAGCLGCPYALRCEPAREAAAVDPVDLTPEGAAVAYAAAKAIADAYALRAKSACVEGPVPVPGGVVGYVGRPEREAGPKLPERLAEAWFRPADLSLWLAENERTVSLLRTLGIGVKGIESVGKVLWPGKGLGKVAGFRELRAALEAAALTTAIKAEFGVHRDKAAPSVAEAVPTDPTTTGEPRSSDEF